jgi:mono/diheme cytochrome c family protein
MNKVLKWSLVGLGSVVVLAGGAVVAGLQMAESRMQRKVDVPVRPVAVRGDAESIERGKYLFASRGCTDCHGANAAGRVFVDDGKGLRIKGPNISPTTDSVVAKYQPQDWDRAIRHGVAPNGRPLMVMPSEDYNRFTDADLGALVAYIRSLPPAAGGPAEVTLPLVPRVLYGFGMIPDAASRIDHGQPPAQPVPEGVTVAHGAYVANMCIGCHGAQFTGGRIPGGPPDWPPAPSLRPGDGSAMARYANPDALQKLFHSGKRPDGSEVKVMPFESLRAMSETDVRALHLYLQSLKPAPKA